MKRKTHVYISFRQEYYQCSCFLVFLCLYINTYVMALLTFMNIDKLKCCSCLNLVTCFAKGFAALLWSRGTLTPNNRDSHPYL